MLDGLEVSELGLGCVGMSEYYGAANDAEAIAAIHRALELGITLLDTADASDLAGVKGASAAQIALAWVLSRGEDVVPIPGAKHVSYLEQNVKATDVELTADDLETLEHAFPAGDRYALDGMRTIAA